LSSVFASMLLLRALSARSYTRIIIAWKVSQLHGYRAENAMKHREVDLLGRPTALARRASDGL
jgi:hypothetical protein